MRILGSAWFALGLAACGLSGDAAPSSSPHTLAAMRDRPLRWSEHARCRMACRQVSEAEVRAALARGVLDPTRTRQEPGRCPTHAVHDRSDDGQPLRVVFAACDDATVVVTVIDLGTDWPCGAC